MYLGVPEMREFIKIYYNVEDKNETPRKSLQWVKDNPEKAVAILWYFRSHIDKLIADSGEWTGTRIRLCDIFWDDCAQESCEVPCSRVLEADNDNSKYVYIKCAECGSSVYEGLALNEGGELFCSHKCIRESQQKTTIWGDRMNDKMDLMWGFEQMERYLSKHYTPATNIMSICTEVKKQVVELQKRNEGFLADP